MKSSRTPVQGSISIATANVLETRFHDATSAGINGSGGAFVALGSGSALANTITKIQLSCTIVEPFEIGVGANAGAAVRKIVVSRGGGPIFIECALASGDKLWVRSLTTTAIAEEYITLNLLG